MKKFFLSTFLFLATYVVFGQNMPTGSIYGRVVDSATNKGLDAASIQVYSIKMDTVTKKPVKTLAGGMLTPASGDFRIEGLPAMAMYEIEISAIGHKPNNRRFSFIDRSKMQNNQDRSAMLSALDKDLGNVRLGIDNQLLSGVTVTAEKPLMQLGIDRKIYNVDKDLMAAGGTATDVMKNIPSVSVDIDGNVSVRNSSPQIFVDGRPTTLTLDQIPADQIETVEVITNPSAKFDASGGNAGILNIVLKKNKRVGYSGNVRAGVDQRGKINGGLNLNLRQGKFNYFLNGHYGQRKSITNGFTDRSTILGDTTYNLHQDDRNINNGRFAFLRGGVDYFLDNRNTITVGASMVNGKFGNSNASDILIDTVYPGGGLESRIVRNSDGMGQFKNYGGNLAFLHNFPKTGHQITADLNYNQSKNNNSNNVFNNNYNLSSGPVTGTYNTVQLGNGSNKRFTAQTDYTNPINDHSKFESGIRVDQSNVNSISSMNQLLDNGSLKAIPSQSANFNYKNAVYAGYVNYSSKIGEKFGYQLGLRLESSNYNGTVHNFVRRGADYVDTASNFKISYPISFFPSLFLSQKLSETDDLQLNYSRRINRPGFFQLFPFIDYSDSLNLSKGNPNLNPEFVNSLELSYSKTFNRSNTFLASIYYKYTNGLITRYQAPEVNPITGRNIYVNTFINANSGFVGGLELTSKNKITKWWDLTSNLNIYTSKIKIDDPTIPTTDQLYSWFGKLNNNFKVVKNLTFQLSGDYTSKTVLSPGGSGGGGGGGGMGGRGGFGGSVSGSAQGYSMPSLDVDAALRYDFLKDNAASVTLSVSDIFRTQVNDVYTYSTTFNQHTFRRRDPQFFRLNFSWRFGKFDASLFKRKNNRTEDSGMDGMGGQ